MYNLKFINVSTYNAMKIKCLIIEICGNLNVNFVSFKRELI